MISKWIVVIWFAMCLILGTAFLTYTFKECGVKTFLLGNGAVYAAATGMCD